MPIKDWPRNWSDRLENKSIRQTFPRRAQFRYVDAFKINCVFPLVMLRTLYLKSIQELVTNISQYQLTPTSDKTW